MHWIIDETEMIKCTCRRIWNQILETYALGKIVAMEITVSGKFIEIAPHLVPGINAVGFAADEFQSAKRFLSTGPIPVKLSALLPKISSNHRRFRPAVAPPS